MTATEQGRIARTRFSSLGFAAPIIRRPPGRTLESHRRAPSRKKARPRPPGGSALGELLAEQANALLQGGEGAAVPGGPQLGDVRLGEALVLAPERVGERDVPDLAAAEALDQDAGDVVEAAALPRADVEDPLL